MVSELDTGRCASLLVVPRRGVDTRRCASEDIGPQSCGFEGGPTSIGGRKECQRGRWVPKEGGLWCPTLIGEENKLPFIRVWKSSPSKRVLKPWREARKGKPKDNNICFFPSRESRKRTPRGGSGPLLFYYFFKFWRCFWSFKKLKGIF